MTNEIPCDVAIIGAGTAGLAAERAARAHGARTLLIDEAFAGTTCTTVGCMPSKLLIAAASAAQAARRAPGFGIIANVDIDGPAVLKRVRAMRDDFVAGVKAEFAKLPDGVMRKGRAHFDGPGRLILDDGAVILAKALVIATGASPTIPAFLHSVEAMVLTNEALFDLSDLPRSIGVVGAGPLGLELAQALARLGVDVAVFDEGDAFAGIDNPDVAASLRHALEEEFPIHLGVTLKAEARDGSVELRWTGRDEGFARFNKVLAAAGRPPNIAGLRLDTTGLKLDEHGAPFVDSGTLQCGDAAIFMAGDVDHARPVLHEAQAEGAIAGRNAATFPHVEPGQRMTPLSIMFTEPAMAVVGEKPEGSSVGGSLSYADQGRAKVFMTNAGVGRIYADRKDGRLLFAELVGPAVEHSAHLLAWAMTQGLTASDLLAMPFYHPTYEEGLKPALREICKAVGATGSPDRDDGFLPGF